jgi:hypothetical protein
VISAVSAEIAVDRPTAAPPPVQEDHDYVFRAQVALTEALLKYGRYLGVVVVVILIGSLAWGGYKNWADKARKADFEKIAAIDYLMPEPDPMSLYGLAPKDDPSDTTRAANLAEGARRYEAVAAEVGGSAQVLAWLRAAEAWERAGNAESSRAAAMKAVGEGTGLADFVGDTAKVRALVDSGKGEEAEALLREMSSRYTGFYAEQALIRLARLQLAAGRTEAAATTYTEITTRFPTTFDLASLSELAARLGKAAPADPDAKAADIPPGEVPPGEPPPAGSK